MLTLVVGNGAVMSKYYLRTSKGKLLSFTFAMLTQYKAVLYPDQGEWLCGYRWTCSFNSVCHAT
jgi:hypothetical protein